MHDCSVSSFLDVKSISISAEEMKYHIMFAQSCFSIYIFYAMSSTAKRLYKELQKAIQLFLMQIA